MKNSTSLIILTLALALLAGCGAFDRMTASVTGYSTICVKEVGVKYVQFASGAAPMIDRNGKPVPCG